MQDAHIPLVAGKKGLYLILAENIDPIGQIRYKYPDYPLKVKTSVNHG
jgi:hypothetical protein